MVKKLRVLFITRAYSQRAGGMERLSWEMIQALIESDRIAAHLIAHTGGRLMSALFVFTSLPRVLAAARQADVIHLGDPMLSLSGWLIKQLAKKPVAVTVHGLDLVYPNPLYQMYLRMFFRSFDAYFPISRHVNVLLDDWHVTGKRVVINPGVHDRFYDPSVTREDLTKLLFQTTHYSLLTTHFVLLTVGRLVRRKGHAWFIEHVFPKLPVNTIYVIAGDGPERERIQQIARQADIAERVVLLGKVTDADLKVLYNTADAFIQPNIQVAGNVEGFGIVLLEAALCNRPVFAADIEGIPDAIRDGKNGTLIKSGDVQAWIYVLTRFVSKPTLPLGARQYTLANFSWESRARQYSQQFSYMRGEISAQV